MIKSYFLYPHTALSGDYPCSTTAMGFYKPFQVTTGAIKGLSE